MPTHVHAFTHPGLPWDTNCIHMPAPHSFPPAHPHKHTNRETGVVAHSLALIRSHHAAALPPHGPARRCPGVAHPGLPTQQHACLQGKPPRPCLTPTRSFSLSSPPPTHPLSRLLPPGKIKLGTHLYEGTHAGGGDGPGPHQRRGHWQGSLLVLFAGGQVGTSSFCLLSSSSSRAIQPTHPPTHGYSLHPRNSSYSSIHPPTHLLQLIHPPTHPPTSLQGIAKIESFDTTGLTCQIGAEVKGFDAKPYFKDKKATVRNDRVTLMGKWVGGWVGGWVV